MALSESRLEKVIKEIMYRCREEENDPDWSLNEFTRELAKAIVKEVQNATITGMCPPNGGPLTQGKLS